MRGGACVFVCGYAYKCVVECVRTQETTRSQDDAHLILKERERERRWWRTSSTFLHCNHSVCLQSESKSKGTELDKEQESNQGRKHATTAYYLPSFHYSRALHIRRNHYSHRRCKFHSIISLILP